MTRSRGRELLTLLAAVVMLAILAAPSPSATTVVPQLSPVASVPASHSYDTPSAATTATANARVAMPVGSVADAAGSRLSTPALGLGRATKGRGALPRIAGGAAKPDEILRPGGELIGTTGRSPGIREVDSPAEIDDLFERIRIHGTPTKSRCGGEGYDLPGGGFVGRRNSKKYGPILDINLPGVDDIFKVHVGR